MTRAAERYLGLHRKYKKEAEELLDKRDYVQASEKLWGATAEMVKAVAAERGVSLGTHRSIAEFVSRLQKEHPELDLNIPFHVANSLHTNFYEDHLTGDQVTRGAEVVRDFAKRLESIL